MVQQQGREVRGRLVVGARAGRAQHTAAGARLPRVRAARARRARRQDGR